MMHSTNLMLLAAIALLALCLFASVPQQDQPALFTDSTAVVSSGDDAPGGGSPDPARSSPARRHFPVHIERPTPPTVELAAIDPLDSPGQAACSTCHSIRPANLANQTDASLDEFHQGLRVSHGKLTCYACHHPSDADSLRAADGTEIAYPDVMQLCSQCHSQQAASYARGAHGGMSGFWDLSRGPRMRKNCVDCHHPHDPKFPKMIVSFKPLDRFLEEKASHDEHE